MLVIESPLLAAHFTHEMDRLWRGAARSWGSTGDWQASWRGIAGAAAVGCGDLPKDKEGIPKV